MNLVKSLNCLIDIIEIETGIVVDRENTRVSILKGFLLFESNNTSIRDYIIGTWLNKYLLDVDEHELTGISFSVSSVFSIDLLYSEAMTDFDNYYSSKKTIKKFNL